MQYAGYLAIGMGRASMLFERANADRRIQEREAKD